MKAIVDLVSGIDISAVPCDSGAVDLGDRSSPRLADGVGNLWLVSFVLLLTVIGSLAITPPNALPRPGFSLAKPLSVPALAGDPIADSRTGMERTGQE